MRCFDCHSIEEALAFIQQKIEKFEENVGEIRVAAAGKAWLSIKKAVDAVLQRGASDASQKPANASTRRPNERHSGIVGIFWNDGNRRWGIGWYDIKTGKKRNIYFTIKKFLQQGYDKESAIEAALQEAKARHKQLAVDGELPLPKRIATKVSAVRGVHFHKQRRKWVVRLLHPVTKKGIHFGTFELQEEAEAKARKITKTFGLPAEKPLRIHC